ncbi:hypothetical protein Bca4012_035810 [Brassica carinata]
MQEEEDIPRRRSVDVMNRLTRRGSVEEPADRFNRRKALFRDQVAPPENLSPLLSPRRREERRETKRYEEKKICERIRIRCR